MSQREAVALVYALARKGLAEPGRAPEALRRIVGIVERHFVEGVKGEDSGPGTGRDEMTLAGRSPASRVLTP